MTTPKKIVVGQPLLQVGCTLGEGPLYDSATSILHFVDIVEKRVYHLNVATLDLEVEQFEESISCLALRKNESGLACAAAQGFGILEGNSSLKYLSKPLPDNYLRFTRFNDGACDSKGRFIAGTLYSAPDNVPGELYMLDPETGSCNYVDGPFTDCNGLGWSPDGKTMYFTDSAVNLIYAYDYDDGKASNRRVFVDALALGLPQGSYCDGLCVDSDGGVWSARWGASRVVRFTPEGQIDLEVFFPSALNITACGFGGPKNDQLYVTSAHCGAVGGDATRQKDFPDSGHLFAVDFAGQFEGLPRHEFGG